MDSSTLHNLIEHAGRFKAGDEAYLDRVIATLQAVSDGLPPDAVLEVVERAIDEKSLWNPADRHAIRSGEFAKLVNDIGHKPASPTPSQSIAKAAELLTELQAARRAGVSSKTIRRRIQEGRLDAVDYGTDARHNYRIKPDALATLDTPVALQPILPAPRRRPNRQSADAVSLMSLLPRVSASAKGTASRPSKHA